ncbi:MAG TPA: NAD(P)-binding protein [Kofleriaceae bacterium]|nr:NAD(P)-binding protein [Kofleriaceae bacterium]
MAKQRIAILGGGMAALTAAFEISNAADWQDHFEITVYQLGWRLGGKGASGRNADHSERIEEHGLHILLGFYDNAFRVLKACYDELGRPPGAPLATWQDAFKPHSYIVLMEQVRARYVPWPLEFPRNSDEPGTGGVLPTPWAMIEMILGWLAQLFVDSPRLPDAHPDLEAARAGSKLRSHLLVRAAVGRLHDWLHDAENKIDTEADIDWRRDFVTVDLALAAIRGMIDDGVIFPPYDFEKLDTQDFRDWLASHGAHQISVFSGYINGIYDLGFSLPGQVGAGTAINGILRMVCTYKGAVMWKMQAGMGDTIFAPLYLVLARRGVRFEFFQRVDQLELSDDQRRVARITIGQQVTLKAGYDPLVDVKDLACWPSAPRYDQLVQGEALRASGCDLEDWWTTWQDPVPPRVLVDGVDFDTAILGCSVGVFSYIAADLIAASAPLAAMVGALGTTQTQAMQLWLSRDLAGLGWTLPSPVLDAYAEPMDTWADMTHLLVREAWPAGDLPRNLAYLCSPLPDDEPPPPRSHHGYAQRQAARVHADAIQWLETSTGGLWPAACLPGDPRCLDWSLLVAPGSPLVGPARFDTQYWIATLNPSDRYVLSLPRTVDKRLATDGAGFANLLLAGDYLRTGLNAGCVEAATMAGMHASRAICGRPEEIVGDTT